MFASDYATSITIWIVYYKACWINLRYKSFLGLVYIIEVYVSYEPKVIHRLNFIFFHWLKE